MATMEEHPCPTAADVIARARLYQLVSENVSDMVSLVDPEGIFSFVSPSHRRILGFDPQEMLGSCAYDYVHPDDLEQVHAHVSQGTKGGRPIRMEYRSRRAGGDYIWTEAHANPLYSDEQRLSGAILVTRDISGRRAMEEALWQARAELEHKVQRRTAELARVNAELTRRQDDLERTNQELSDLNAALRILLDQREKDRQHLEDNVMANVRGLVLPFVEKLRGSTLSADQHCCLEVIAGNLEQIVSAFSRQLSSSYTRLTPREIQIAALIRDGRDSKEMAGLLGLSPSTIEFHRRNLRCKLGLRGRMQNLRSFLLGLK